VTSVDPATQLAALIRVQVASLRRREEVKAKIGRRPAAAADKTSAAPRDLATLVAQRIRSIAPEDPQRERKAFRMFLETVLLSEFGQSLVGDPAFVQMVDQVQGQMEKDPELAQASRDAARLLLKSSDQET
jgi:hypothetical protein